MIIKARPLVDVFEGFLYDSVEEAPGLIEFMGKAGFLPHQVREDGNVVLCQNTYYKFRVPLGSVVYYDICRKGWVAVPQSEFRLTYMYKARGEQPIQGVFSPEDW